MEPSQRLPAEGPDGGTRSAIASPKRVIRIGLRVRRTCLTSAVHEALNFEMGISSMPQGYHGQRPWSTMEKETAQLDSTKRCSCPDGRVLAIVAREPLPLGHAGQSGPAPFCGRPGRQLAQHFLGRAAVGSVTCRRFTEGFARVAHALQIDVSIAKPILIAGV